jgi:hypothetical protein
MVTQFKEQFLHKWKQYFPGAELPILFYFSNDVEETKYPGAPAEHHCFIGDLARVRRGESLRFDDEALGCAGGKRYLGFSDTLRTNFEYFLSCGIEGELEGERYKKTPELVKEQLKLWQPLPAPTKYIVFKRFDHLKDSDAPLAVIFFATPDVLSGLFTLANYDEPSAQAVTAPFGAGCASIVYQPLKESHSEHPRAVLGMFDVSARPYVDRHLLTFAIPWKKFTTMVDNMDESFLITNSWKKVERRIAKDERSDTTS